MDVPQRDELIQRARPIGRAASGAAGIGKLGAWRQAIVDVIDAGGPEMHLQPIVDFAANRVAGFEALARFTDGPSTPDGWFARAHQVGLGPQLEAAAVCAAFARRDELAPHQFLTVNLSPAALADPVLHDVFRAQGSLTGVVVELTEHDAMSDRRALDTAFDLVRGLGGLVAIDDIGTGYAGLEWLLSVRPELVKLDREFIRGVDTDEAKATFVRFVGDLVDKLDTWLIAEGIETDGELEAVVALGVPLGQGYRLGRPDPVVTGLRSDVVDRILQARTSFARPVHAVGAHVEHPPLAARPGTGGVVTGRRVLLDHLHRPLAILEDGQPARGDGPPPLTVKADEDVRSVALRALARGEDDRWRPLAVTDEHGRYEGIIRMERLIRALADDRSTPP